jgi:sterol desaturase/sphingolipid hydroxylase (fatty acid hydroxylase superfamily)
MVRQLWSGWIHLLERAIESRIHYWATIATDAIAAAIFLVAGVLNANAAASLPMLMATMALGFLGWGLLEYALHRWILHGPPTVAQCGHMRHHAESRELLSTPIFVIAGWAMVFWLLLSLLLPPSLAAVLIGGTYAGYNYFAWVHHLQHHRPYLLARVGYFRGLARHHLTHHGRPTANFGISTGLWDRVFRTGVPAPRHDQ